MSEHTPGPWYVEELTGIAVCRIHDTDQDSEKSWISNIYDDQSWDRCKANARLIAAAPDLLEALLAQCIRCQEEGCNPDRNKGHSGACHHTSAMCAAVAKARGEA